MIYPPPLHTGDSVAIVSPAGRVAPVVVHKAVQVLREWGLEPEVFPHALDSYGRFAASDDNRLADLKQAILRKDIKAIYCSRGGYGVIRLLEQIDTMWLIQNPKWIIGYSDITLLHTLSYRAGVVSLHAPMLAHLASTGGRGETSEWLRATIFGAEVNYTLPRNDCNRVGVAQGKLIGGNLSLLYGLRGTPYEPNFSGKILFIEDIAEEPYHLERIMYNFHLGGVLANLAGLIVGHFTNCKEDEGIGYTIYEMIAAMVEEYDYPCCFGFPVGHEETNYPLLHGGEATLIVSESGAALQMKQE